MVLCRRVTPCTGQASPVHTSQKVPQGSKRTPHGHRDRAGDHREELSCRGGA